MSVLMTNTSQISWAYFDTFSHFQLSILLNKMHPRSYSRDTIWKETRTAIIPFQNRTALPLHPTLLHRQTKNGHAGTDQHQTGSAPATMKFDGDGAEHRETGNPPAIPNLVPLRKPKSNLPRRHQSHASATPGNASSEPQAQGLSRSDRSASSTLFHQTRKILSELSEVFQFFHKFR